MYGIGWRKAMADDQTGSGAWGEATAGRDYADRLVRLRSARWKQVIDVQAPYRWNIRRLQLGRTLDIGCGLGRNLNYLGGESVGVDHNADAVAVARSGGLTAYTPEEFHNSPDDATESYDSLLLAHVVEHMARDSAVHILRDYLAYLKPGGRLVLITPQAAGYRTDATHVRFVDFDGAQDLITASGCQVIRRYSFPFARIAGRLFPYNEFVTIGQQPPGLVAPGPAVSRPSPGLLPRRLPAYRSLRPTHQYPLMRALSRPVPGGAATLAGSICAVSLAHMTESGTRSEE